MKRALAVLIAFGGAVSLLLAAVAFPAPPAVVAGPELQTAPVTIQWLG